MDKKTKILLFSFVLLLLLSISATFYKDVVLQEFTKSGVWIEFTEDNTSYVWFIYDEHVNELTIESQSYDDILREISSTLSIKEDQLDQEFLSNLEYAHNEAAQYEN